MSDYFLRDEDGKRYPNPSYFNIIDKDSEWNWLCTLASSMFTCEYQDLASRTWGFRLGNGYTMEIKKSLNVFSGSVASFIFFDSDGDKECTYHVMGDVVPTVESLGAVLLSAIRDYWADHRGYIGYEFKSVWNDGTKVIEWEEKK